MSQDITSTPSTSHASSRSSSRRRDARRGELSSGTCRFLKYFVLPALSYLSAATYGFPANLIVLGGYVGWLLLRRFSRILADLCGVAFLMAVALVLTAVVLLKASLAAMILLPSGLLYLGVKVFSHRLTRRPVAS